MISSSSSPRSGTPDNFFLDLNQAEVLTDISIDSYQFKVTLHPWLDGRCVLWFRDESINGCFNALGHFTQFDKRSVLFFVARFATSPELRAEIENRRFARQLDGLTRHFFDQVERKSRLDKNAAFRSLFNLDADIDPGALARRRRMMALKFHPDAGGNDEIMSLINEAYDYLSATAVQ
ncbi:MAG: J domain-containing protein [Lentisphaerae bacterium]|nr:J domain-containing protein [Lentisphaerota bacterium]